MYRIIHICTALFDFQSMRSIMFLLLKDKGMKRRRRREAGTMAVHLIDVGSFT